MYQRILFYFLFLFSNYRILIFEEFLKTEANVSLVTIKKKNIKVKSEVLKKTECERQVPM